MFFPLEGNVLPQSSRQFHRLFADSMLTVPYPNPIQIELDSQGGDLTAVLRIVRIIQAAQREKTRVSVTIQSGKRCFSTCMLMFAAADHRQAAHDAWLSFPNSTNTDVTLRILSGIAEADPDLANHLLRSGVPEEPKMAVQLGHEFVDFITVLE